VARNGGDHVVGQAQFAEVNKFVTEVRGLGLRDVDWADEFPGDDEVEKGLSIHGGLFAQRSEFLLRQQPHITQQIY
jgi:hypothetical protein